MLLTERQPKNVEHDAGNEEETKVMVESSVEKPTSMEEDSPVEDTKPDEDAVNDETEADAGDKEVSETHFITL